MVNHKMFTTEELSHLTSVPVRTIRYYIAEGLLPGSSARGKGAAYTDEHLLRLRLIRLLAERRVPLADIKERLAGLTLNDLRLLLAEEEHHTRQMELATEHSSPREYVSKLLERARQSRSPAAAEPARESPTPQERVAPSTPPPRGERPAPETRRAASETWRRVELAPGVEVHIRADAESSQKPLIERLLRSRLGDDDTRQS